MEISNSFIPVEFDKQSADQGGKVNLVARVPVAAKVKVVGVNVKTDSPCDQKSHKAEIEVISSSSRSSSDLFKIGVNLINLPAFDGQSGQATVEYRDCEDCVSPFDVGCENPRPPKALTPAVEGTLFQVTMKIEDYAEGDVVNAVVALCYGPPDS